MANAEPTKPTLKPARPHKEKIPKATSTTPIISKLLLDGSAVAFAFFLSFYGILKIDNDQVIDNNTLTAITLLIAESSPKEKDIIIDLIMNFLIR